MRPPRIGAIIGTTDMPIVTYPIRLAAASPATMSRTTARDSASPVATAACAMRNTRNHPAVGAAIVPTVAATKIASAPSITGRRPQRSLSGPTSSCTMAEATR